jgi:hypothetical protein
MRFVAIGVLTLSGCPKAGGEVVTEPPAVRINALRYEAESATLYVEAALSPGSLQGRDQPVFLGVTAVTPDGHEIDLMVNELFPTALGEPVVFYAEVGAPLRDVLIGAWDKKIEPCDVDRMGCQQFGFVLDGPLASWPPGLYEEGLRQRIPPAAYRVRIEGEGARAAGKAAEKAIGPVLAPFGSSVEIVAGTIEPNPGAVQVRYGDEHDLMLARLVADAVRASVGVEPELLRTAVGEDDVAIAVGAR